MSSLSSLEIEKNLVTIKVKFHNNNLINWDILYFIYCYKHKEFRRIGMLMEFLINKTKALYLDEMYVSLLNHIDAIVKIKNFINKYKNRYKTPPLKINNLSLNLTSFNKNYVKININNSIYTFDIKNLVKLYKFSLLNVNKYYYLNCKLEPLKNPYTNIEFSIKEHIIFYENISKFYMKIGKFLPNFLVDFKICYFNTRIYKNFKSDILCYNSVNSYLLNTTKLVLNIEFKTMIRGSSLLERHYCSLCFKCIDIRLHFLHAIKLYILNSNSIYSFGLFEEEYVRMCSLLNIKLEPNHIKSHRRILKTRVRRRNIVVSPDISIHPLAI